MAAADLIGSVERPREVGVDVIHGHDLALAPGHHVGRDGLQISGPLQKRQQLYNIVMHCLWCLLKR